jgi:hypothetical protein
MSKEMRLAIISFPLAFLPGLLTALFHDVLIKPSIWWGFHLTYAVACFVAVGVLCLVLRSAHLRLTDVGLRDFRPSHVGWLAEHECSFAAFALPGAYLQPADGPPGRGR